MEYLLEASWAVLGASWGPLGPSWAILEPSWAVLVASWADLEASWTLLGRLGGHLGPYWAYLEAILGHLLRTSILVLGQKIGPWASAGILDQGLQSRADQVTSHRRAQRSHVRDAGSSCHGPPPRSCAGSRRVRLQSHRFGSGWFVLHQRQPRSG